MIQPFKEGTFKIIPSVRKLKNLEKALQAKANIIFLSEAHIGNLRSLVTKCHQYGKIVFVNIDILGGLSQDQTGIKFLKDMFKVDGVMSASTVKVNIAKSLGFYTIQRFFLIDSRSYDMSLKALHNSKVDAIEILPALFAPHFFNELRKVKDVPLLAGGFINKQETAQKILAAGFSGITTSCEDLW